MTTLAIALALAITAVMHHDLPPVDERPYSAGEVLGDQELDSFETSPY